MGSLPPHSSDLSGRELLESALRDAHDAYTDLHPKSAKSYENSCKYLPGGNTRTVLHTTPFPLTIASGYSCKLKTVDGQEYTDFLGEYTAGIFGHNNPVIRQAIDQALDNGWNYGGQNAMEAQLAQILCERFPAMEKVRFVNSGTEANMIALGTAVVHTGKKKILVFKKGYHGSTISGRTDAGKPSLNLPHQFVVAKYNDIDGTRSVLDRLPKDSLAAILVEPVLGSGGCFTGSTEFLSFLRSEATKHDALLIFDEVMTSRLSYHGLGHQIGITPDLMTIGKWVGGGMSFGAFGGREDIMDIFDPRLEKLEHAGTFNNNVLSMSAGIAGCTLLNKARLDALNARGTQMLTAIEHVLAEAGIKGLIPDAPIDDTPAISAPSGISSHSQDRGGDIAMTLDDIERALDQHGADVPPESSASAWASDAEEPPKMFIKGVGSMMTIHFTGPNKDMLQGLFYHHMLKHKIYLAQRGFIALSIEITDDHVGAFVDTLKEFCKTWIPYLR